jgi:hypothetical protein
MAAAVRNSRAKRRASLLGLTPSGKEPKRQSDALRWPPFRLQRSGSSGGYSRWRRPVGRIANRASAISLKVSLAASTALPLGSLLASVSAQ